MRHQSEDEAQQEAARLAANQGRHAMAYPCHICHGWHVGHTDIHRMLPGGAKHYESEHNRHRR